jgi:ectoine hydroxylase-related dioxygenase (phytanoyl-CoA dioxygenase family)
MSKLTQDQVDQFEDAGYLVVRNLLDVREAIDPIIAEYEALLDALCQRLHAEGKLLSSYAGMPFGERLTRLYADSGANFSQHFDISLPQGGVTVDTPFHLGPAVFHLLTSPRLLDAVEALIGPEIVSNPVQHVRIKPPQRYIGAAAGALVGATSWHQDQGVVLPEADASTILTVWVPITAATAENGCLTVIPGSHREGLATHCRAGSERPDLHIPSKLLHVDAAVPLPMQPGDVLFMHRRTQHASLENRSDNIRWSFDLRYNPAGEPTGRPAFPEFLARSRSHPERVLAEPQAWAALWEAARDRLAGVETGPFNRWHTSDLVCA